MTPYPLIFDPILKAKVWGGRRLERYGKRLDEGVAVGESWELADLPDSIPGGRSVVANGPLAGTPLRAVLGDHGDAILGAISPDAAGGFPLLIKYLDARANLSVQVHPDEAYAAAHPDAHLKSEAWVVLEADPGAVIYKGLADGVTRDALAAAVADDTVVDLLTAVPVRPGECHYLPSGTCHALGAGVFVAEVQTPSDTTFRLYDWGRTDRELHIDQALDCIDFDEAPPHAAPPVELERDGIATSSLTGTPFFTIEHLVARREASLPIVSDDSPVVWMVVAGRVTLDAGGGADGAGPLSLERGGTVLLPARLGDVTARLEPGCEILRVAVPSPAHRLHA